MTTAVRSATFGKVKPAARGWLVCSLTTRSATASWEAYCPFGGLEMIYKFITSDGKYVRTPIFPTW